MRKITIAVTAVMLLSTAASAGRITTDEKALESLLPGAKIEKVAVPVTAADLAAITKAMGGKLYNDGKEHKALKEYEFHVGMKDGKKTGYVLFLSEKGKWGDIGFAVGIDLKGKVLGAVVTETTEKRGRPVATKGFLKQFVGKDIESAFAIKKDVNAVAGATISTEAVVFAVKKTVVIFNQLFLKK